MFVKFVPLHNGEVKHTKMQVDQDENLSDLREKLKSNFKAEHFKVLFHGRLINDFEKTLSHYKMNSTSTIHVIETTTPPQEIEDVKKPPPSEDELQQFMISFGLAIKKDKGQPFRKIMQRLGQRENLENIAATCPELTKDPIARAFLSKPELIYSLLDPDTLKYIYEKHPSICEAANQLCAAIHEEKSSAKGSGEETLAPFAFNMDEDSDDDDEAEDMDTGDVNRSERGRRSIPGNNPITADQFASALAAAQSALGGDASGTSPGGMGGMTGFTSQRPPTSAASNSGGRMNIGNSRPRLTMPSASSLLSTSQPSSSRGPGITQDQLAAALAFATGVSTMATPPSNTGGTTTMPNFSTPVPLLPPQDSPTSPSFTPGNTEALNTMRELGITDQNLASRALEIMGGDVQAAIGLIYSGWNGEE